MEITKRDIAEHLLRTWITGNEVIEREVRKKLEFENAGGVQIAKEIGIQEHRLRKLFYLLWGRRLSEVVREKGRPKS